MSPRRRSSDDSDVTVKPQVEAALIQFGRLCKHQKAEVFVVKWELELGKGIDDLIVDTVFIFSLAHQCQKCITLTWLAPQIKPTRPIKEEAKKSNKQEIIIKKKDLRR